MSKLDRSNYVKIEQAKDYEAIDACKGCCFLEVPLKCTAPSHFDDCIITDKTKGWNRYFIFKRSLKKTLKKL